MIRVDASCASDGDGAGVSLSLPLKPERQSQQEYAVLNMVKGRFSCTLIGLQKGFTKFSTWPYECFNEFLSLSITAHICSEIEVKRHLCAASSNPQGEVGHPTLGNDKFLDVETASCFNLGRSNSIGSPTSIFTFLLHRGKGGLLPKTKFSGITW